MQNGKSRLFQVPGKLYNRVIIKFFGAIGIGALWVPALFVLITGCGPFKQSTGTASVTGKTNAKGPFSLKTAIQTADTVGIRQFLAGNWNLDKTCRSTYVGLKCDSSIKQRWQLDSLAGIHWTTEGADAGTDRYYFVAREGAQAGSTKGVPVWIIHLSKSRRAYVIKTLTKDSLAVSQYPLMMDNTTTFYLSRQY